MRSSLFRLPLNLTLNEVYPYLGIKENVPLSVELSELIKHYLKIVRQTAQPQAIRKTFRVNEKKPARITLLESPLVIEGIVTALHFSPCASITLIGATIGDPVDELLADLGQRQPSHALICDAIASAAVEHLVERLDADIAQEIRHRGYFPTARYSPGYGDWPLLWQKAFLESLGAQKIGMSLNSHLLLQPVKSVTAAIGWSNIPLARDYHSAKTAPPCHGTFSCQECPLKGNCKHTKQAANEHIRE